MKVFVLLELALACISAASIPGTSVALKDAKRPNVIKGRIINGVPASATDFPYQVFLSLKSLSKWSWCSGSLIGKSWVLTAAHCTDGMTSVTVYLGSTVKYEGKIVYNVSSIIQHTDFNPETMENDLSLIKIPEVTYTDQIKPISLPASSKNPPSYAFAIGTASGWGKTYDNSEYPLDLRYGNLRVLQNDKCAKSYGKKVITKKSICIDTTYGENICDGDSGGPLVFNSELIGVASFVSSTGCQSRHPGVFVRVTSYLDWINTNI